MIIYLLIFAGITEAIAQYVDKHLVNLGISKKDYFYYMCLTMIPYSILMLIVELYTGQFKFSFEIVPIFLLILAMFIRYFKQQSVVGCLKYLNPYENSSYLSLTIILAFIIDVLLGIEDFTFVSVLSIFLTVFGILAISNAKIKKRPLQKDLFERIFLTLAMGYVVHFILQYWSNAIFLLIMNILLVAMFAKNYSFKYHKKHQKLINWSFLQQFFGFASLYVANLLTGDSVTLGAYVKPISIVVILVISLFLKKKSSRPTLRQIIGVVLVIIGIGLIN